MEITSHTFNSKLKRLEPISKKCAFCDTGVAENVNDCHFALVYQVADRTNIIVYSSVKYKELAIGLPRCKSCKNIHTNSSIIANTVSILVGIATLILAGKLLISNESVLLPVFVVFAGIFIAVGISIHFVNYLVDNKDINTEKEGVEIDVTIQDFLLMGWSLTPPQA